MLHTLTSLLNLPPHELSVIIPRDEESFFCDPTVMAAMVLGGVSKLLLPIVAKEISKAVQRGKQKKAQKSGKGYHHAMARALRRHKQSTRGSRLPYLTQVATSDDSDGDGDGALRGQGIADGDTHDDDARANAESAQGRMRCAPTRARD